MEILELMNSMAPYLLLGFFLAGIMHAFVPGRLYKKHLSGNNFKSVLYSTLFAIPMPLCSCGTIPAAMSLRKEGASKGAVISFLIATPQTGLDSIMATYSLMGLPFAIIRPIAALVTALFGGCAANAVFRKENDTCKGGCEVKGTMNESAIPDSFWGKIKCALRYSFVEMMQDIGKWLIVGLFVAGLITLYVPDSFFLRFTDNTLLGILVVLICAIPMYICATGSIPIAIALMLKGMSPGAALVLLMAGPAVNVASMLVIYRVMGLKPLLVYLLTIVGGAVLFACGIDYLVPREVFTGPLAANSACCARGTSIFNWICSISLMLMLINAMILRFFGKKDKKTIDKDAMAIHISGMKCTHCQANAQAAIQAVPGVKHVEIELSSGMAYVTGEPDFDAIAKALEALGFKAEKR